MRIQNQKAAALLLGALIAALSAGCGSSSTETEASAAFVKPGAKNTIVKFGKEADSDERETASKVLEESLKARAAHDWATQCATLSAPLVKEFEERGVYFNVGKSCPNALKNEASRVRKATLANSMTGPIDALRVKGDRGFALYHGAKGKNYAMRMALEDGDWKVAEVETIELP